MAACQDFFWIFKKEIRKLSKRLYFYVFFTVSLLIFTKKTAIYRAVKRQGIGWSVGVWARFSWRISGITMLGTADTAVHKTADTPVTSKVCISRLRAMPQSTRPCERKNNRVKINIITSYKFSEILDIPEKPIKVVMRRMIQATTNTIERGA